MENQNDWLEKHRNAQYNIGIAISKLERIKNALCIAGNSELGDKLDNIVYQLSIATKQNEEAVSQSINEGRQRSQASSANMLATALAVSSLNKKGK